MEKIKAFFFILIVLVLTALSAHSQRGINGRVVEVLDGRTCVLEVTNTRITVILQHVETPEPEQPLYEAVKAHFEKLVLNKWVEFYPRVMVKDRTVGQLLLQGRDVSQQMLRDGAAWYAIREKDSLSAQERDSYESNEAQAKLEKRGVWGVENLQPAWEFRYAREREKEEEEKLVRRSYTRSTVERSDERRKMPVRAQNPVQPSLWADVSGITDGEKPAFGGLYTGYDAARRIGYVSTQSISFDVAGGDFLRPVEARAFHLYRGDQSQIEKTAYAIAFMTTAKDFRFINQYSLVVTADNQKLDLGKAVRFYRKNYDNVQELLVYRVKRGVLARLATAKKISLTLGKYPAALSPESAGYIKNMLNASN